MCRARPRRAPTCSSPRCSIVSSATTWHRRCASTRATPCARGRWTPRARTSQDHQRSAGGNPQTGPFFVEGALPGDTLVVHLKRIRLNRDRAVTTAYLIGSTVTLYYHAGLPPTEFGLAFWQLDRAAGVGRLEGAPSQKLKDFTVPLRPMLGGIGVAPDGHQAVSHERSRRIRGQSRLQPPRGRNDAVPAGVRAGRAAVRR